MRVSAVNLFILSVYFSLWINSSVGRSISANSLTKKSSHRRNKSHHRHKAFDPNNITAFETARSQLASLFDKNVGTMSRPERIFRIVLSWILLLTAKIIALANPLYFKKIIESGNQPDEKINFLHAINLSISNLILALGFLKLISGFVQLVSEYILAPTLSDAAETLPNEVFSVALKMAGNRGKPKSISNNTTSIVSTTSRSVAAAHILANPTLSITVDTLPTLPIATTAVYSPLTNKPSTIEGNRRFIPNSLQSSSSSKTSTDKSTTSATSAAVDTNKSITPGKAFYSHLLDRGIKASSLFLYRAVYNLLPTLVESLTVFVFICTKVSYQVGITVGIISIIYVAITTMIMSLRIPTQRQHLNNEKVANGFAEDALTLAETIAVFGTQKVEEQRYASALRQVSQTGLWFRQSFSILKFIQCLILAFGAAAVTFATYHSHTSSLSSSMSTSTSTSSSTLVGKLVLSSSLFAQICMPLDYVGQHIRDCITSAEDLRELDVIRRSLRSSTDESYHGSNDCTSRNSQNSSGTSGSAYRDSNSKSSDRVNSGTSRNNNVYKGTKVDEKGFFGIDTYTPASALCSASLDRNCRLYVRNLSFHIPAPSTTFQTSSTSSSVSSSNTKLATNGLQQQQPPQQHQLHHHAMRALLSNITFSVPSGGYTVALVGPSGSGKSTLLRVLVGINRLQIPRSQPSIISSNSTDITTTTTTATTTGSSSPFLNTNDVNDEYNDDDEDDDISSQSTTVTAAVDTGEIYIDGYDMTRASVTDRALHFAMVCQDNELFRGLRLGGNIRYGTHHISHTASPDSIAAKVAFENAIDDSFLRPVVNKIGLEAEVGPLGRFLSGGERQRVCIARALYREELLNRCILLMDEITSSLDATAERGVVEAIRKRVKGRGTTAIFVAHRLASIQQCDLILVLKEGNIVERGTHKELMRNKKTGGWYAQAWSMQQQQAQDNKSASGSGG